MSGIDGVDMVGIREAATLVERTPETVRRWVWSGRLPAVKKGNRLLVNRADLREVATGQSAPDGPALTLAEWRATVAEHLIRKTGRTASDLVLADRRQRSAGTAGPHAGH